MSDEVINLRDKVRIAELEKDRANPPTATKSVLEGLADDEVLTVAQARALQQENYNMVLAQEDTNRLERSEDRASSSSFVRLCLPEIS